MKRTPQELHRLKYGFLTYTPTRRERKGRPHAYSSAGRLEALTRHHGAFRKGLARFVKQTNLF